MLRVVLTGMTHVKGVENELWHFYTTSHFYGDDH